MASISLDRKTGRRTLQFIGSDSKRRSIRLGKVTLRQAEAIKVKVEQLRASLATSYPVEAEVTRWLLTIEQPLREKLEAVGLLPKRQTATVAEFTLKFIARHTVKDSTKKLWHRSRNLLVRFFKDRTMDSVTLIDVQNFREWAIREGGLNRGLAENTVRQMCATGHQFFADAVQSGLATVNPFSQKSVPRSYKEDRSRSFHVTREMADKVLACCSGELKLLFALSRFGGLRCPSEHFSLCWEDITDDQIKVTSPKTEHHVGGESRMIPLFPEIRAVLEELRGAGSPEAGLIFQKLSVLDLRKPMLAAIKRAGLSPWPKLFHNLRASRETELTENYPIQTVCAWIGNSPTIAIKHYLTVPEEHFERASVSAPVHIPVQQPAAIPRNRSQSVLPLTSKTSKLLQFATDCEPVRTSTGLWNNKRSRRTAHRSTPVAPRHPDIQRDVWVASPPCGGWRGSQSVLDRRWWCAEIPDVCRTQLVSVFRHILPRLAPDQILLWNVRAAATTE